VTLPEAAQRRLLALGAGLPDPGSRWRVLREVGRGGMGVVYEAEDLHLHRRVALKVLHGTAPELRARFLREAAAAARLAHPNIAAVYDASADAIAMQFVDGQPIAAAPRDARRCVRLVRDAARAVHYAHGMGLVHRDLKPGNLLVEGDTVFVVDFGLAKDRHLDASHSVTGGILGTPSFMAPEQAQGRTGAIDARTDVYGLGATLYACLAGRPPFEEPDLPALLRAVVEREPRKTGVDADLDVVLQKALRKEPEQRYATAAALADDLDRWLEGRPVLARTPSLGYRLRKFAMRRRGLLRATGAAALVAALATGAVLLPELSRQRAVTAALELSSRCASILDQADRAAARGRLAQARERLEAGIAEARAFLAQNDVARGHMLLGRLLRKRGMTEEARAAFDRALALDPALDGARFERGLCSIDLDPQQAILDLAAPVRESDHLSDLDERFGRAERHRLLGELTQARDLLLGIVGDDPLHADACLSLSKVYQALGDDDRALRWSVRSVDLLRGFGPAYDARERVLPAASGLLDLELPGIDGVLLDIDALLAGQQIDAYAFASRGLDALRRASSLRDDPAAALAACEDAIARHHAALQSGPGLAPVHNNRGVAYLQRARLLRRLGRDTEAEGAGVQARGDFDLALHHDPSLQAALRNRALALLHGGDAALAAGRGEDALREAGAAVAACTQALSQRRDLLPALLLRAAARELIARAAPGTREAREAMQAALADYGEALHQQPRNADALRRRGALYARCADFDAARSDLRAALLAAPIDWPSADACRAELAAVEQQR
jgi:tetratricopeptide (TPR) repeat protein/predicted Ser/Thr protein kinase